MKLGARQSFVQSDATNIIPCLGSGVVRLERRILDIVDTSPSEMMLASLEPETLLAWCCAFFGMALLALGWSCTGLLRPLLSDVRQFFGMLGGQGLRRTSQARRSLVSAGGGGGRWGGGLGVDSVRVGVLLLPRAVDVFL